MLTVPSKGQEYIEAVYNTTIKGPITLAQITLKLLTLGLFVLGLFSFGVVSRRLEI